MHGAVVDGAGSESPISAGSAPTPYKKDGGPRPQTTRQENNLLFKMNFSQNIPFLIYDDKMASLHDWLQTRLVAVLMSCSLHVPRLLLLLLLFSGHVHHHHSASAQENCTRKPIVTTIRYRNCAPRRIMTAACSGQCLSYTRTNPNFPLRLDRACRCCREGRLQPARVRMRCPKKMDPRRNMFIVLNITLPRTCLCRPCSFEGY